MSPIALPVVALLLGFPWIGGIPWSGLKPHRAAPADSTPPPWRSASLLAVEDRFVFAALAPLGPDPGAVRLAYDPRQLRVSVQPDSGTLSTLTAFGDVRLGTGTRLEMRDYSRQMTQRSFEQMWRERARQRVNAIAPGAAAPRGGLSFQFPSPLPRRVQSLLGPGGPALHISGSENIVISGQSNWTNQQVGPLGQKRSLFPSLDMQQDLDIRLDGQLSDRIHVNMLQNSANQIPLANRIAINYKGDEDDLVQNLDLGNTNLTLPGTQYVSYSGKNEGLFGAKATTRIGPLDFTILASKQEGRSDRASYAGGAVRQTQSLRDIDYVRGTYYLLYDPNGPTYDIDETSLRVYLDDANYGNDVNIIRGRALIDPLQLNVADSPDSASLGEGPVSVRGAFHLLNPGADRDYEILRDVYGPNFKVIRLLRPVSGEQRLAASYSRSPVDASGNSLNDYAPVGGQDTTATDGVTERILKLLRPPGSLLKPNEAGTFDTTLALDLARELEMRNFYNLPGQRIDPTTLKIKVRKGPDEPPKTSVEVGGFAVPYIEFLGLDNYDETTGTPTSGHDGRVDGIAPSSDRRTYVDFENGVLFLPDPRPFAPRLGRPFEAAVDAALSAVTPRRGRFIGDLGEDNAPNTDAYDKHNLQRDTDTRYYIDVDFTAARATGEIILGRGNLIEASEVVTVSGQQLVRDRDYTIDYDLGRVTLKRQLGPADNLNIDYSYAPLFQQAGRTLIGSAFRFEGRERNFGGAFLYEAKGAQDLRPRLGEEPSRSLIGDLNTDWTFRPDWVTRVIDRLPGVRTTAPSEARFQAEVGSSFPNPNTRNEVFIDDMEGVRDAVSLPMSTDRWRLSSVPMRAVTLADRRAVLTRSLADLQEDGLGVHNAEVHWYSPYSVVKERDLKPTLNNAQGAQNIRSVLALSMPRRPATAAPTDSLWGGLTYTLDNAGFDLSQSQFIELWVNDFRDRHNPDLPEDRVRGARARLHVDLGVVSEDQMRAPNQFPNGRLDSEDKEPRDLQLVVTSGNNEDTGYDGHQGTDEVVPEAPDLTTVSLEDPAGDDFHLPDDTFKEVDPRRFRQVNGSEQNKQIYPYPDTEDLDLNNNLDTQEDYFEFTIDLGDTSSPYLITDVYEEFAGRADVPVENTVQGDNGWRRYRIPIDDVARVQFGVPNLTLARHVRVWVEGIQQTDVTPYGENLQRPLLLFGGLDIVGSRWRAADMDSASEAAGATVTLNSVNSLDNADIYVPPFDPGQTRSGAEELTRREQSLAIEFAGLPAKAQAEAFRTFSIDEDYTRYGTLGWFARGFDLVGGPANPTGEGLAYFVRFGSDERGVNYYEYRAPMPSDWTEVRLKLTELANLKLEADYSSAADTAFVRERAGEPGTLLIVKGRPSFTRIRRISVGLVNLPADSTAEFESGQFWFNELRALDVARDIGRAQRLSLAGRLSNLLSYNLGWNGRDADFLTVGDSRGMGSSTENLNAGGTFELHRFFEATRIVLPVTFGFSQTGSKPRFSAGDDVVRQGSQAAVSRTFSDTRSWAVSYSRDWGERAHPLLKYTVAGINANYSNSNTHGLDPTSVTRGTSVASTVNYTISPRALFALPLPFTSAKLFLLPEQFYWNYLLNKQKSQSLERDLNTGQLIPRSAVDGRAATVQFGASSRPFEAFSHRFDASRNLMLESPQHFGFLNLGRVVRWNQAFNGRYSMTRGNWLRPAFTWNSRFNQDNGPELSRDLSVRSVSNGQAMTMRWELPFATVANKAPKDSAAAGRKSGMQSVLGRLGNVATDFGMNWSSNHTRLTGIPNFLYLVGVSQEPGLEGSKKRVSRAFGNQSQQAFDWRGNATTRIALALGASVTTNVELTSRLSESNDVERRQDTSRFPDLSLDYGKVAEVIRLNRFVTNPKLRTAYNRSQTISYDNGRTEKSTIATSSQWQPLLGLSGDLKNGTRMELSVERRNTQREALQLGRSITNDRNTDINLSLNRSFSQGQKVKVLGKETTVRSSVSMGMSAVYSVREGETVVSDNRTRNPHHTDRLSVNANGSYGFSNNVTGNLTLGFGQERDLNRDIVRRNIRVELRGAFTF